MAIKNNSSFPLSFPHDSERESSDFNVSELLVLC